jgi:uncharacterized membrane protein
VISVSFLFLFCFFLFVSIISNGFFLLYIISVWFSVSVLVSVLGFFGGSGYENVYSRCLENLDKI